jgi:hypothetical protein
MNQEAISKSPIEDLNDYFKVFSIHGDYRVSGISKAAKQRYDAGDVETARQWLIWAASKV